MEVDEDNEFATCPYCGTKHKLNEDKNINIRIDKDTRDFLKQSMDNAKKNSKIIKIPIIITFFIVFGFIIFTFFRIFTSIDLEKDSSSWSEFDIKNFNIDYEIYSGTKTKNSINILLDNVVTNNKKEKDHLITVIYNEYNTTNPDEIVTIKQSLKDWTDYEIKLDYDDIGLVNKVTIEDIN